MNIRLGLHFATFVAFAAGAAHAHSYFVSYLPITLCAPRCSCVFLVINDHLSPHHVLAPSIP